MAPYTLTLSLSQTRSRLLLQEGPDEILKAYLPGCHSMQHPKALLNWLEGLALWLNQPLLVVVSAIDLDALSFLGLTDDFGIPCKNLFFTVRVVEKAERHLGKRVKGIGNFTDLRQLRLSAEGLR
jgi:hypothetical protein